MVMKRTASTSMSPAQRSQRSHRLRLASGMYETPARVIWAQRRRYRIPSLLVRSIGEGVVLFVSVALIWWAGAAAHRWMTGQIVLLQDRSVMQDLTTSIRAMRFRAMTQHRMFELRIDPARRSVILITSDEPPGGPIERVERTVWLPEELSITEAPATLQALPDGSLSPASIIITSSVLGIRFHVMTMQTGVVRLNEETSL